MYANVQREICIATEHQTLTKLRTTNLFVFRLAY